MYLPFEKTPIRHSLRRSDRQAKRSKASVRGRRGKKSTSVLRDRENGEVLPGRRHLAGSAASSAHSPAMGKLATTGGRRVTRDNEEDQAASACPCGPSGASSGCAFVAEPIRGIAPRGDAAVPTIVLDVLDPDQGERVRECRSRVSADARTPEDPSHGSLGPGRDLPSLREATRPPLETVTGIESSLHRLRAIGCASHRQPIRVDNPRCTVFSDCKERVPVTRRVPATRSTRSTRSLVAMAILAMCTLAVAVPTPKPNRADTLRTGLRRDLADSTGLEDVYEDAFEDVFREDGRTNAGTVLDENELEIIRRSIARGLGLKRIPDPAKANVSQGEYERAHREYLKKVHLSTDEEASKSRRSLHVFHAAAHPGNGSSRIDRGQRRHRLFFPVEIPEADGNASVDHATLRLLLHGDYKERSDLNVLLYLNTFGSRRLIVRKKISGKESRWLELESTVAVSFWLGTGLENLEFELEFLQHDEPVRRSYSSPVLNVFTESSVSHVLKDGSSRSKRSTPKELMSPPRGRKSNCKAESKKCCRHELTVMFKDLKGFEFIVYPKTFDAGYCKGGCPPRYNPANHHALLQSLLWKEDRKKVPKPCCTPSKLDELMIVYFDENDSTQLKVTYWQNIKALECACS